MGFAVLMGNVSEIYISNIYLWVTSSGSSALRGAELPAPCLERVKIPAEAEETLPNRRGNVCVTLKKNIKKKAEDRKFIYIQKICGTGNLLVFPLIEKSLRPQSLCCLV